MDILNLAQGMVNGSGLPMQAEPIAGPKAVETPAQTPAAFNDALLNVINSLMVGQTKTTRDTTVSAVPLPQRSDDDDDETADAPAPGDSLLKADAPQQLLEALLMTSQMPVQPSHHMAKVPGATFSCSISSFSQLPHSGKVLRIHDSRVMVFTLLIVLAPDLIKNNHFVICCD